MDLSSSFFCAFAPLGDQSIRFPAMSSLLIRSIRVISGSSVLWRKKVTFWLPAISCSDGRFLHLRSDWPDIAAGH